MKITKEVLAKLREALRSPYMSDVDDAVVLALLDERKALRAALENASCEVREYRSVGAYDADYQAALALGEDEE